MRKLIPLCLLGLLITCQEAAPAAEKTAVPAATAEATAVPSTMPASLPAPVIAETPVGITAVPPTASPLATESNEISEIIAQVDAFAAQFQSTMLAQTGWLYDQMQVYQPASSRGTPAHYTALADNWVYHIWREVSAEGVVTRQVQLVYDGEGGIWERSAIIESTSVRVLPEKTIEGQVNPLDEPQLYQTPYQSLLPILRDIETAQLYDHTVTAWEENGRYHIQTNTLFHADGQSLNGSKMHVILDMETGQLIQQQFWTVSGTGEETLQSEVVWQETAVVSELPALAAQTLSDAQTMLAQGDN